MLRSITRTTVLGAAALAIGATSAAAVPTVGPLQSAPSPGPGISATDTIGVGGCAAQCITGAAVTAHAASADVEVTTSAPASVTVRAHPAAGRPLDLAAGGGAPHVSVPTLTTSRNVHLAGLAPDTLHVIVVTARDAQGRTSTRQGTFRTKAPQVAVPVPDLDLAHGSGCAVDCIGAANAVNDPEVPGRTRLAVATTTPAKIEIRVQRMQGGSVTHQRVLRSAPGVTSFSPRVDGLHFGRAHRVIVTATDANGSHTETGSFTTAPVTALVSLHRLQIIKDGDKGVNRGELHFDYLVDGKIRSSGAFRRYSSGSTIAPRVAGSNRAGVTFSTPADDNARIDMAVRTVECDTLFKNCVSEAVGQTPTPGANPPWAKGGGEGYAWATLGRTPTQLLAPSALPGWYGTGVTQPKGHDAYVQFRTPKGYEVDVRVLATVDFTVDG